MSRVIGKTFPTKKGKSAQTKAGGAAPDVKAQGTGATQEPQKEEK